MEANSLADSTFSSLTSDTQQLHWLVEYFIMFRAEQDIHESRSSVVRRYKTQCGKRGEASFRAEMYMVMISERTVFYHSVLC